MLPGEEQDSWLKHSSLIGVRKALPFILSSGCQFKGSNIQGLASQELLWGQKSLGTGGKTTSVV